jgi:hypothetical protein
MQGEVVELVGGHGLATLAAHQHSSRAAQVRALGFKDSAIDRRVAAGRLHRLRRGLCAVGQRRLSPGGRWMAAAGRVRR